MADCRESDASLRGYFVPGRAWHDERPFLLSAPEDLRSELKHEERFEGVLLVSILVFLVALALGRRRRRALATGLSLITRVALILALAYALAEPSVVETKRSPGALLAAVDESRSVKVEERERVAAELREAARIQGAIPKLVSFGDKARADRSNPGEALARLLLSESAMPGSSRLVLATDGSVIPPEFRPGVTAELAPLVLALGRSATNRVRVDGLELVAPPVLGEPVQLRLVGHSDRDEASAKARFFLDGRLLKTQDLSLKRGPIDLVLTLPKATPGRHAVTIRLDVPGEESLDDSATCVFEAQDRVSVAIVSSDPKPLIADALLAQDQEVSIIPESEFLSAPSSLKATDVIVLDRVATAALSLAPVHSFLTAHLENGGGLWFLPRDERGEIYNASEKVFLNLLPLTGLEPPPPEKPKDEAKPETVPGEGLKPPDAEAKTKELRAAPSLGLLLVLDASGSMLGENLALAKAAAVAAAGVLHPEDQIGVIAFNSEARTVLELTKAEDQAQIRDRISRIRASGGTNFAAALSEANNVLGAERLAIRHVILLSDGQSQLGRMRELVTDMATQGITVSTVGCGTSFDERLLSDIAAWGRGKFHPAYNASEVPQIFTIEAERVIQQGGARRRPKEEPEKHPQKTEETVESSEATEPPPEAPPEPPPVELFVVANPAPYLEGVQPTDCPGILGRHGARVKPGAWLSLKTERGDPVLAHQIAGKGRIAAMTVPMDGPSALHLSAWDGYQTLAAQLVRFLALGAKRERFGLWSTSQGRFVRVRAVDVSERHLKPGAFVLRVTDEEGLGVDLESEEVAPGLWHLIPSAAENAAALRIALQRQESPEVLALLTVPLPPVPEISEQGIDLEGLDTLARDLGGEVVTDLPKSLAIGERTMTEERDARLRYWPWLLGLFLVDLLLKRVFTGRSRIPSVRGVMRPSERASLPRVVKRRER